MSSLWLFKTEPSTYSFEDLVRDGRTVWDGVKNPVAQKHLRSAKTGDPVIVYHTGDVKSAVGLAKVVKDPYPDPRAGDPKLVALDLAADRPLASPVSLAAMKANRALAGFDLLRLPRLSVVPVDEEQWKTIMEMAGS